MDSIFVILTLPELSTTPYHNYSDIIWVNVASVIRMNEISWGRYGRGNETRSKTYRNYNSQLKRTIRWGCTSSSCKHMPVCNDCSWTTCYRSSNITTHVLRHIDNESVLSVTALTERDENKKQQKFEHYYWNFRHKLNQFVDSKPHICR